MYFPKDDFKEQTVQDTHMSILSTWARIFSYFEFAVDLFQRKPSGAASRAES